jgi:ribosome-binding factor A
MGGVMARSYRLERLNESIKELLSELILKEIRDPRVGFVTVTSVKVSSDLMTAKVYFSFMGSEEDRLACLRGLSSARSFLRRTVSDRLSLRHAPEFQFVYDDSLDKAMKIEEALKEIKKNETPRSDEDGGE